MAYRRGVKTEANDIAREVCGELGLRPLDQLAPRLLAGWLEIEIVPLSDFLESAPSVAHLLTVEQDVFSAVTVFCGTERTVVHNDAHVLVRQNSNITHELSHGLLPLSTTRAVATGIRTSRTRLSGSRERSS